jgi:hypothetical protein
VEIDRLDLPLGASKPGGRLSSPRNANGFAPRAALNQCAQARLRIGDGDLFHSCLMTTS